MAGVWTVRCGIVPYEPAWAAQRALADARRAGDIPDVLLLLEHSPVYTKGRRYDPGELGMGEEWYRMQGIEICETDRGGRVTYHGPGQLVGYPIVDLRERGDDVHAFVRDLEAVMLGALDAFGVPCQLFDGLTGVWTLGDPPLPVGSPGPQGTPVARRHIDQGQAGPARKIGAIGVHVSKGVTTHGFAVNVSNDLQPFEWIVPCGIEAAQATSLTKEHRELVDLEAFAERVVREYGTVFEAESRAVDVAELVEAVPGAAALAEQAVPAR